MSGPRRTSLPLRMAKLLLMSILFSMIIIPTRVASREKNAAKGLRTTIKQALLFNLFYLFVLLFLYGRV